MQAKVPKFLEIEDKIMLGLSGRQILELGIASGFVVLSFALLVRPLAIAISFVAATAGITFAFVKINGRDAHHFIFSLWSYFFNPRKLVWQKEEIKIQKEKIKKAPKPQATPKVVTPERLREIALMLDVAHRLKR